MLHENLGGRIHRSRRTGSLLLAQEQRPHQAYRRRLFDRQHAEAGIYWIKIDFSAMTYTAVQVSMIEYYAASWADNSMSTVYKTLTYKGKGVWELLDYDNEISVNSSNDTRHRFNMTTATAINGSSERRPRWDLPTRPTI